MDSATEKFRAVYGIEPIIDRASVHKKDKLYGSTPIQWFGIIGIISYASSTVRIYGYESK